MTAEVVIMNREAVVLAADSAVTIGGGPKILNTANKVFMLVPKCPVGVLIYNNASLMGVPWEIVIKEYRDYIFRNKIDFPDLVEYGSGFLNFIEENGARYVTEEQEVGFFKQKVYSEYGEILRTIWQEIRIIFYGNAEISDEEIKQIACESITKYHNDWVELREILPEEKAKNFRTRLQLKFGELLSEIIKTGFEEFALSPSVFKKLEEIGLFTVSKVIQKEDQSPSYSGIVFAGYGKNNLFPVCINFEVYNYLCETLAFVVGNETRVGFMKGNVSSVVIPFAQQDITHTLLTGRLPVYEKTLKSMLVEKFDEKDVDAILKKLNSLAWENHTKPIIDTIDILPKDELASVAKTLVNLTSFMRHVSSEIETVGGPIDVAVISKKDGFVWIDRKHYFDIEKNLHFGYEQIGESYVKPDREKGQKGKKGL